MHPAEQHNPVGYVTLVRQNRGFRLLWFGQIISLLGDWFDLIASASLVGALTQSGLAVGGLFVVRMLAPFLVSPLAGVAADRYNRKHLLIIADAARAVIVLGFLLVREPRHVWLLYAITAIQLGLTGLYFPTRHAILPDIVTRRELGAANALSSATWSVMLAFGAALGGLFAGRFGVYPSFVIDSATFVTSALILSRVVYQHKPPLSGAQTNLGAAFGQYLDGLRYLRHHLDVLFVAFQKGAAALFAGGALQVVIVSLGETVFVFGKGGGTGLGLLYGALGVGTGLGPILARRFTGDRDRQMRIAIVLSYLMIAIGLSLAAPLISFPVVLAGTALHGFGMGVGWVFSTQLLLHITPDRVRGRVFSTEFALQTLSNAIGALAGGWALDLPGLGIHGMLLWMRSLILIPGLLWAAWTFAGTHTPHAFEEPEPAEQAAD